MSPSELLSEVQMHLMEPPDGGVTFPAEVWDRDHVEGLLNQTYRDFVGRTKTRLFVSSADVESGTEQVLLDLVSPTMVDIHRVAWLARTRLQHIYRNAVVTPSRLSPTTVPVSWVLIQACDSNPGIVKLSPTSELGTGAILGPGDTLHHTMDAFETKSIDLRDIWVGV